MSTINESIMTLSGMEYYEGKNKDRLTSELAKKVPTTRKVNNKPLSADITLSDSDVGLGNVGNFKSVSTVANQGLIDTEKSNARANIGAQAAGSYAAASHTHDDRYYTESEINTKLNGKANSSHTHGNGDITSLDASKITSGTISIDRLPQGALERLTVVADDTARFKLTSKTVQKGDTVKVTATSKMYYVVDESKLSTEDGYEVYTAGTATSVPWSGVTGKPGTYTPSSHTHDDRYYTESEIDSKLSGKANSSHTHTIANITNLQSTLDGKAASNHTHTKSQITDAITGIKMNGTSKGTSGVVDLGTVLTGGKQSTTSTADGGSNVYTFSDGSTITVKNGSKGSTGANGATPTIKAAAGSNIGSVGTPSVTASTSGTTTTFTFNNLKGSTGVAGTRGTALSLGTAITGTSTTATIFSGSGLTSSLVNDVYLNTSTFNMYKCTVAGNASAAKWVYVGCIKGANGTNATTTAVATTSANGLMSKDMVTKLNGIATGANNYTHPATSGNKHIPSGGSSGQILRWSADGTAVWGADNNTWTAFKGATSSAAGTAGYVPAPAKGDQAKFFRADGTWQTVSTGGNKTAYQTSEPTGQSNNDEWLKEY